MSKKQNVIIADPYSYETHLYDIEFNGRAPESMEEHGFSMGCSTQFYTNEDGAVDGMVIAIGDRLSMDIKFPIMFDTYAAVCTSLAEAHAGDAGAMKAWWSKAEVAR